MGEGTAPPLGYVALLARLDRARRGGVLLGLDRMRAALAALGNPERRAVAVQIAGTNGKGSTAAMTEAMLRAAGLRTGLYSSPHLSRFTERIRIDGSEVDGELLAQLDLAVAATGVPLTYFEIATALAFCAFAEAGVDVVVLETGLGGRLDATTAAAPLATAITSIALDHTDLLGPTLVDIAREKAGIAKPAVPLLLGPVPSEADAVIRDVAAQVGAPLRRFGVDFGPAPAEPALPGAHQATNAAVAAALARLLVEGLPEETIRRGLAAVRWPGRLERVGDVLLDCAHNAEGATALAQALDALAPARPRALVISIVVGKDASAILTTLAPRFDFVIVTRSANDRALPVETLLALARAAVAEEAARARAARTVVMGAAEPALALAMARAAVTAGGSALQATAVATAPVSVVVAGSMFLVGEVRAALLGEPVDPISTSDPLPPKDPEVIR